MIPETNKIFISMAAFSASPASGVHSFAWGVLGVEGGLSACLEHN